MKAVVIYWSKTQNTEKVAIAIREGLESGEAEVSLVRMEDAGEIDFFDYDLVCVGFPSYRWRPPDPADEFLLHKFGEYRKQGKIQLGSPRIPGKNVQIFVTYSGPHTGIREAVPAGLYAGQYFDHLGFNVLEPW